MRGAILVEQAYAQGKMLDHTSWRLVRGISPSDIDFVIESGGNFGFVEFSKNFKSIEQLNHGQKLLYERLISRMRKSDFVGLAYHNVPEERSIDTCRDVISAEIYTQRGNFSLNQEQWEEFIATWTDNPACGINHILPRGKKYECMRKNVNTL